MLSPRTVLSRHRGRALVVACACSAFAVPPPVAAAASTTGRPLAQAGLGSLPSLLLPSALVLVLGSVAMFVTALRNSRR